jgi:hypothetical protein
VFTFGTPPIKDGERVEVRGDAVIVFSQEDGERSCAGRASRRSALATTGCRSAARRGAGDRRPLPAPLPDAVDVLVSQLGFHLACYDCPNLLAN